MMADVTQSGLELYQRLVLGHEGVGFTEYRNINGGRFVGINPRKTKDGTTNQDVARITCIVVDIDLQEGGTTDGALDFARCIMMCEDFASCVLVSSGRGAHLYLPVDLPITANVKGYLDYLRSIYQRNGYVIDKIHDPARVIRVWGSKNEKNGKICHIVEDHFDGTNQLKMPEVTQQVQQVIATSLTYPNGSRNNTLTSLAGSMRSKGLSVEAITSALLEENKQRCNPPLSENEVRLIATSIGRYTPKPVIESKSFSNFHDKYLAELMNRQIGYSTGFDKLDGMLAGLQKGRLYVLVARTSEGKTTFSCNLAYNLLTQNVSVLYFPTELGYGPLFDKIVARASELPLKAFQFGNFNEQQKQKVKETVTHLSQYPFTVEEDFALTLDRVTRKTKESLPNVVIIDFINAMKYTEGGTPQEIAANVRGIKELAADLNMPIILNAQFNRGAIQNEISLQYIKGSGAIEEFADVVMALQTVNKMEYPRTVDLHILKNRYSEIGKIRYQFYSTTGTFKEA